MAAGRKDWRARGMGGAGDGRKVARRKARIGGAGVNGKWRGARRNVGVGMDGAGMGGCGNGRVRRG